MEFFGIVVMVVYGVALLYITFFCLAQFNLLYFYNKFHKTNRPQNKQLNGTVPFVTIQLPIFNEMYVVERLIDNLTLVDYPKDRFEIQVLDDSTDETIEISKRKVEEYEAKGFQISLLHRKDRSGYKAGALQQAMSSAKGQFVAIFDADFLPSPDFLQRTIPYFDDPQVGVVQTRWEHINEDYSILTKLQALQLNVHFRVEQQGRSAANCFLQFNGTAGVWRAETISNAGGWEADTLTEDLDLSYRAQLNGWKIKYLEELGSPAELPAEMIGIKSQQFRWMKGGAETAKKMMMRVMKSDLPLFQKFHAFIHLMASAVFLFVFIAGVFSVPMLFALNIFDFNGSYLSGFLIGLLSVIAVYFVANVQVEYNESSQKSAMIYIRALLKFLVIFPIFLSLSMGLSLHNTVAILQGYRGKKSAFIRTPKFNLKNLSDRIGHNSNYLAKDLSWTTIMEGVLTLYFLGGIIFGIYTNTWIFIIFHVLLMLGFGSIFFFSIKHMSRR